MSTFLDSFFDKGPGGALSRRGYDQPVTRGLDRLESSQGSGSGSTSTLGRDFYGGSAGASYRRQEEAYGRALKQLRHASRRGDTGAALREIAVRDQATEAGFDPGGVQRRDTRLANMRGTLQGRATAAQDREQATELERERGRRSMSDLAELDDAEKGGLIDRFDRRREARDAGAEGVPIDRGYQSPLRQKARPLNEPTPGGARKLQTTTSGAGRGTAFGRAKLLERRLA